MAYDEHLTVKIATLYYKKEMSQELIAGKLGLSRQSVGRYLRHARDQGIIEFTINSGLSFCSELEFRLESAFGLLEAVVVSAPMDSDEFIKDEIGKAAASFLERRIIDGQILGVSWSSTVFACAKYLKSTPRENMTVVQLNGSMDRADFSTRAEFIIEKIAASFKASPVAMAAPLLVDSDHILQSLLADSRIQATYDLALRSTAALFGIGSISRGSSLYKTGYMNDEVLGRLTSEGAVGDICGHFFDLRGNLCDPFLDACLLAVPRESFREKPLSIGVAGGAEKVPAIQGALAGGWCNVLITDEETAKKLLENVKGQKR